MAYIPRPFRLAAGRGSRPGSWEDDGAWLESRAVPTMMVHEDEPVEPTGLLDSHGNELVRVPDRVPVGFHVR